MSLLSDGPNAHAPHNVTVVDLETPDGPDVSVFTYAFDPAWSVDNPAHDPPAPSEDTDSGEIGLNDGFESVPGQGEAEATRRPEVTEPVLVAKTTSRPLGSVPVRRPGEGSETTTEGSSEEPERKESGESLQPGTTPRSEPAQTARPARPIHFPDQPQRPRLPAATSRPSRPIHFPGQKTRPPPQRPPSVADLDDEELIKHLLNTDPSPNFPVSRRRGRLSPYAPPVKQRPPALTNGYTDTLQVHTVLAGCSECVPVVAPAGDSGGGGALVMVLHVVTVLVQYQYEKSPSMRDASHRLREHLCTQDRLTGRCYGGRLWWTGGRIWLYSMQNVDRGRQ